MECMLVPHGSVGTGRVLSPPVVGASGNWTCDDERVVVKLKPGRLGPTHYYRVDEALSRHLTFPSGALRGAVDASRSRLGL
jgi:hypothetical protein